MNTTPATAGDLAQKAADALAALVPSDVPLVAVARPLTDGPTPDEVSVRASYVGARSADLVVVARAAVQEALAGAGALVSIADALRPALEAAAAALGEGVLGEAQIRDAGTAFDADGLELFALEAAGEVRGWFGLRVAAEQAAPAATSSPARAENLRLLYDVEMTLTAEIGRAKLPVRQVLDLTPGTVVELDRVAGSPADLMVNGRLIARGEVVVVDEDYGLRITEILDTSEATA